jgi:hypothetical protein
MLYVAIAALTVAWYLQWRRTQRLRRKIYFLRNEVKPKRKRRKRRRKGWD